MNINVDSKPVGFIKLGLFGDIVPKTVANFVEICNGNKIMSDGNKMHYD
jgi:cyclophilin family peptidyl-prolyl cis-trans isomerase